MTEFGPILQAALTPVALISGVGLLLLSMVNRYNHALDRTRHLLALRKDREGIDRERLEKSILLIYGRCRIMKNAILCVLGSIVSSGFIVFFTVLEGLATVDLNGLKAGLLVLSVALVVVAAILFVVEVIYSLHAIQLEIES